MKPLPVFASAILAISACAAQDIEWTYAMVEGEDATSAHYYFYRSDGDSVVHLRWVWNGGAQNAPTVTEYLLGSGKITVRHLLGKRESIDTLIAGKDAELELQHEYSLTAKYSSQVLLPPPPDKSLTDSQRTDLKNLIDLLAKERKPYAKDVKERIPSE